jgi:NAD(P)-dependent dehydrogenase (short-subunit alcohol dehydrogenase family)/acyl carrier protein
LTSIHQLKKRRNLADWLFLPTWKESPLSPRKTLKTQSQSYSLVFSHKSTLISKIVKRLKRENQNLIEVQAGTNFSKIEETLYFINPLHCDHYEKLFLELKKTNRLPERIIHLWNLSEKRYEELKPEVIDAALNIGFYSLLFISKAKNKYDPTGNMRIAVVTSNMHEVTGEEHLHSEKATILGACKVIPQEYHNVRCRNIDVVLPESAGEAENKFITYLLSELKTGTIDNIVAYRAGHRWTQTFVPILADQEEEKVTYLRRRGIYLIVGGLGKIGYTLSEHFAKTVQARLILIGRSSIPDRKKWAQILMAKNNEKAIQQIHKIQELERFGSDVFYVSADIANLDTMLKALAKAEARFGAINGVIHAAGVIEQNHFSSIDKLSEAECRQQFAAKIYGLVVLEKILRGRELDFRVLFSSLSSILGGLGFAGYSAANNFMDAFARQASKNNSKPWTSVNWDGWLFKERKREGKIIEVRSDKSAITAEEGIDVLRRILSLAEANQIIVSTTDLDSRINEWIKFESMSAGDKSEQKKMLNAHRRPTLDNAHVAPRNEVEKKLSQIWQQLLGIEEVGVYDDFFELGGHSLLATQINSQLREAFDVVLPLSIFFNATTIAKLSEIIIADKLKRVETDKLEQIIADVEKMSEVEVAQELLKPSERNDTRN